MSTSCPPQYVSRTRPRVRTGGPLRSRSSTCPRKTQILNRTQAKMVIYGNGCSSILKLPSPLPSLLLLLLLRSPLLMLLLLQLQLLMLLLLLLLIPLLLPFHSKPNSNPRVHTGGPLQIHGSAQAVPYKSTGPHRRSLTISKSKLPQRSCGCRCHCRSRPCSCSCSWYQVGIIFVPDWYQIRIRFVPDSYQIGTRLVPYSYQIGTRFVPDCSQL